VSIIREGMKKVVDPLEVALVAAMILLAALAMLPRRTPSR